MNASKPTPGLCAPAGDNGPAGGTGQGTATLTETKNSLTQAARETAGKLKTAASDTAGRVRDEAARMATEKKEQAATRLDGVSSAIHESAKALEPQDPNIAWFTHKAAERLQGVADYVRKQDFAALRTDAENLARRHPAAFFGGLFVAGLVLGNVVKASRNGARSPAASGGSDELAQIEEKNGTNDDARAADLTTDARTSAGI